jgi:hypothetical protein
MIMKQIPACVLFLFLFPACGDLQDPPASATDCEPVTGVLKSALGTTYRVGPGQPFARLQDVAGRLAPGDVVEVSGGTTYPGDIILARPGTESAKITIRGLRSGGRRPVLSGGTNTIEFRGDHYVFEGFEVTGGGARCVFHHAHDILIRDSAVHDCPAHGITSADTDSGSLTLDYVEVYRAGAGDRKHPLYVTTDQLAHPGAVFRMQHCYVHDGNGGNHVKSRAQRNEIYYNWIEGGYYRELELIGPEDPAYNKYRADSDVVGNVLWKRPGGTYVARIGGDGGGGDAKGRFRFVNNTIILQAGSPAVIQAFARLESLEMHNNIIFRNGGGAVDVLRDTDAVWTRGARVIAGQANWLPTGSNAPSQFTGTQTGTAPGFANLGGRDVHLTASSPLLNRGTPSPDSPTGSPFPAPLALPAKLPPLHVIEAAGTALSRPSDGQIDPGAYEEAVAGPPPPPSPSPATCFESSNSPVFKSQPFTARDGTFTAEADVTPGTDGMDGALALSSGPQRTWRGQAAIVLFNASGQIVARNGGVYQARSAIRYQAGTTYRVRMDVNVAARTYSVYVTPAGGSEFLLAADYAFRTEQASVTSLSAWGLIADIGSLKACGLTIS